MNNSNHDTICEDLLSGDLERQAIAMQMAKITIRLWAEKAVEAMLQSSNPYLLAERLPWLGQVCLEFLAPVLKHENESEINVLAALVFNWLGKNDGDAILVDVVRLTRSKYALLAVNALVSSSASLAERAILEGLVKLDKHTQYDHIVCYVGALQRLGCEIPISIASDLASSDSPWQVRTLFMKATG